MLFVHGRDIMEFGEHYEVSDDPLDIVPRIYSIIPSGSDYFILEKGGDYAWYSRSGDGLTGGDYARFVKQGITVYFWGRTA